MYKTISFFEGVIKYKKGSLSFIISVLRH